MSARSSTISPASAGKSAKERVTVYNLQALSGELSGYGCAVLLNLLSAGGMPRDRGTLFGREHFRSHIHMARHGFGKGEYRYFKYPLPQLIGGLRTALYPHLATIANEWNGRMAIAERYSDTHASFLKRCHDAGQTDQRHCYCSMFRRLQLPAPGPLRRSRIPNPGGDPPLRAGPGLHRRRVRAHRATAAHAKPGRGRATSARRCRSLCRP